MKVMQNSVAVSRDFTVVVDIKALSVNVTSRRDAAEIMVRTPP